MSVHIAGKCRGGMGFLTAVLIAAVVPAFADLSGVTWGGGIEVATGDAYVGPWRANASVFEYVDDPAVAIDADGVVGVAWADQPRKDIFFRLYAPDGTARPGAPVDISRSPDTFSWLPRIVIAPGDPRTIYILWQEIIFSGGSHGGDILFARSTDGGSTFGAPVNLSNSIDGDGKGRITATYWHNGSLDLAIGPSGVLYAAWSDYQGHLWFNRSTDRGESFTKPSRLAGGGDEAPARAPALAVGAKGVLYLAWTVGEDMAADIRLTRSVDGGRSFDVPRIVYDSDGYSEAPKIAVDGEGTVHLVYGEGPRGPFAGSHIRYVRLNKKGRRIERPRVISGPHGERFESVNFPALAMDAADNLYVTWETYPSLQDFPRGLEFTYSDDGGHSFTAPAAIPGSADAAGGVNGSRQGMLMKKLAVNRSGAIAVVNSTFRRNEISRILLVRGQAAGP